MIGFTCGHCHQPVLVHSKMGTGHRNHCHYCLWSKHVDNVLSGDRKSLCNSLMQPLGLVFKIKKKDKYHRKKLGEVMIVHRCTNLNCAKININRIAADDDEEQIIRIFNLSNNLPSAILVELKKAKIHLIRESQRKKLVESLFGKNFDTI